jgi:hypothetical protein
MCDIPEVLSGLGDGLAVEADSDAAELLIAVGDIEVDLSHQLASRKDFLIASTYLVSNLRALCRLRGLRKEDKSDREDQQERDDESLDGRSHDA